MSLAPGQRLGAYEIVAKLGEGGMGVVWRARDSQLGREVALKVLPPEVTGDGERLGRFEREARLLAQLNHPNIAHLYAFQKLDGAASAPVFGLVMELAEGPTLADRLAAGALPVAESLAVGRQIAEALEAAHAKGIVHRDLKPHNVKLTADGQVKVLDFGLAKAMETHSGDSASELAHSPTLTLGPTVQGVILGTAGYMAPEQAKGLSADRRADVWAFGVVLWEMLTGRRLFDATTAAETLALVLTCDADLSLLPPATPAPLRSLLRHCLERNPKNRLHDIADARLAIDDALQGRGEEIPTPARASRRSWLWLAAALGALLALGAGWLAGARRATDSTLDGPLRFNLVASAAAGTVDGTMALSPDGATLAFVGLDSRGRQHLYARSLVTGAETELIEAQGGSMPFWSPDASEIGFFTDDALYRVSAGGGARQKICDARGSGGTWNRDGVILFGSEDGIRRVSATGGESRPITKIDTAHNVTTDMYPFFLPDGDHFLYLADADTDAGHSIRVGALSGGDPVVILRNVYSPVLFAREHLVYVHEGALVVQRFDAGALRTEGAARALAPRVAWSDNHAWSFAVAGDRLVWVDRDRRSHLRWLDRRGAVLEEIPNDGDDVALDLSPDGRRAVLERVDEDRRHGRMWVFDLERRARAAIPPIAGSQVSPVWSSDESVVFLQFDAPGVEPGDYVMTLGRAAAPRLVAKGGYYPQGVSRDGRWLTVEGAFTPGSTTNGDIGVTPIAGGPPRPFATGEDWENMAQFSPDGTLLAYSSAGKVVVEPYPPTGARWQVSGEGGGFVPRWSPRGDELFFVGPDETLMVSKVTTKPSFRADLPQPLFRAAWRIYQNRFPYAVAPDGQRILALLDERNDGTMNVLLDWTAAR